MHTCWKLDTHIYFPQTKLREGNVFTPVFHSVHRVCVCVCVCVFVCVCVPARIGQGVARGVYQGGVYPERVSIQRGVCLGGVCPGDVCSGRCLSRGCVPRGVFPGDVCLWECTPPEPRGRHSPYSEADSPPHVRWRLKWVVRILQECILVLWVFEPICNAYFYCDVL